MSVHEGALVTRPSYHLSKRSMAELAQAAILVLDDIYLLLTHSPIIQLQVCDHLRMTSPVLLCQARLRHDLRVIGLHGEYPVGRWYCTDMPVQEMSLLF